MTNEKDNQIENLLFSEAPASWNTRYVDANGFECQLTLRAGTGQELLEKAHGAISHLLQSSCQPYHFRSGQPKNNHGKPRANGAKQENDEAWCPIHNCQMKRWEKDGRVWYSHKANGEWCKGKTS